MGRVTIKTTFVVEKQKDGFRYCHVPLLDKIDKHKIKATCELKWPKAGENGIPLGDTVEVTIDSEDNLSVLDLPDG